LIYMTKSKRHKENALKWKRLEKKYKEENSKEFSIEENMLKLRHQLCVPDVTEIKEEIMKEVYCTPYTTHPENTKMYQYLLHNFWWEGMKRNIAQFCAKMFAMSTGKSEA